MKQKINHDEKMKKLLKELTVKEAGQVKGGKTQTDAIKEISIGVKINF